MLPNGFMEIIWNGVEMAETHSEVTQRNPDLGSATSSPWGVQKRGPFCRIPWDMKEMTAIHLSRMLISRHSGRKAKRVFFISRKNGKPPHATYLRRGQRRFD